MATPSHEYVGPRGGNWAYWTKNAKAIGEFIKTNAIPPATIGPAASGPAAGRKKTAARAFIDLGIRGGIRVPHLHFKNRIYLLSEEQWIKFSAGIISQARATLAKVNTVSFEEGLALGSMADMLVK